MLKQLTTLSIALTALVSNVPMTFAGTQASIKIEQVSASKYGTWTLLSADGTSISSTDKSVANPKNFTIGLTDFQQTTLSVTTPAGMDARISVYRGDELIKQVDSKQFSFPLLANDNYRLLVTYSLTRTGSVGVTSAPSNLRFRMKSNSGGRTYTAISPHTFTNLPAGKYSLYFPATDECLRPAVQTVEIEPDQRTVAEVTLTCNQVDEDTVDRSRISKRSLREYVEQREVKTRGNRK